MSDKKLTIIKDASFFSIATVVTQLISMVSAILMRRFLGPAQVGIWALVQMVLTYAEYSNLGVSSGITREIPYYQGKGDSSKVESLKNTAFYFSILTSTLVSGAVFVYAILMRSSLQEGLFWGLLLCSGLVMLQRLNGLLIATMRAFKQFSLASHQMIWSAVVNAALVAVLSHHFKLYGFMWAMILSFLFNITYIFFGSNLRFHFSLKIGEVKGLISYGFPLMLLAFFGTLFETIDKIIITKFLGLEKLGLYSIALMTATYLSSLPNAVGIVMIPNIHEKYGQTGDKRDLRGFTDKSDEVFSGIMPVLIGLAWFIAPAALEILLPKFMDGVPALQWLSLSVFFLAVGQAYSQKLYVFRQHYWFFPIFTISSGVAIMLNFLFIRGGWGIEGVAIATTLAMAAHFHIVYFMAGAQIRSRAELLGGYFKIMGKFVFMLTVLIVLRSFVNLSGSIPTALVRTALMLAVYAYPLWRLERRLSFFQLIFKKRATEKFA